MNPFAVARIAVTCTCSVQRKLLRFAWNGNKAVRAFERRRKRNAPFFPAFLMLSITNHCNLQCKGCWVEQTSTPQQLSLAQMQGIIDTARKYDSRFFGILGGEPLFHADLFTLFADNPTAYFQLFTNGIPLTESVVAQLAKVGNVTPLISIEGLEDESRIRRGKDDVFARSLAGLERCVKAGLFTGVAASINQRNFDELVSTEYLDFLVKKGVHYIWYYIYRPCGSNPDVEAALTEERILTLRRFIVEQRRKARILIIDAYWDGLGNAVCPGAMGLSHHIAPNGAVEFCPIVQFTGGFLNDNASNLEELLQSNPFLERLRKFTSERGRNCILMESPEALAAFMKDNDAVDSSNRDGLDELSARLPLVCHDLPGKELPEKSLPYRIGKKFYFFGFGAYG